MLLTSFHSAVKSPSWRIDSGATWTDFQRTRPPRLSCLIVLTRTIPTIPLQIKRWRFFSKDLLVI